MTLFCIRQRHQNLKATDPAFWVSTACGVGLLRPASGTWGSLAGLALFLPLITYTGTYVFLISLVLLTLIGMFYITAYQRKTGAHDASEIVIDEVCGQGVTLACVLLVQPLDALSVTLAFFTFRLFDILKPWPACWADQKLPGAYGVMLDDLFAGVMAGAATLGLLWGIDAVF